MRVCINIVIARLLLMPSRLALSSRASAIAKLSLSTPLYDDYHDYLSYSYYATTSSTTSTTTHTEDHDMIGKFLRRQYHAEQR